MMSRLRAAPSGRPGPAAGPFHGPPASDEALIRRLSRRWLLSLGLLGAFCLTGLSLFVALARTMEQSAVAINACGRQRMLSQRAALLTSALVAAGGEAEVRSLRSELLATADRLEAHRRDLLPAAPGGGAAISPPPVVQDILFRPPHDLDRRISEFVGAVRAVAETPSQDLTREAPGVRAVLTAALEPELLDGLDAVAGALQKEAERRAVVFEWATAVVVALSALLLLAMALYLFRPMRGALRGHLLESRERERILQLTLDSSPLGIATCDPDGTLLTVSRALCRTLGYSPSELRGRTLESVLHPDEVESVLPLVLSVEPGEDGKTAGLEARFLRRGGEVVYGRVGAAILEDEQERPSRLIVHLEDRTLERDAQEEARRDRERLAQVMRLTTMGEMAAGIAHEINQPLTAIATYAQACRRLVDSGRADARSLTATLEKMGQQAHRAGEVIRRLRSFLRDRRGKREEALLDDIVRDALKLAEADARFHDVQLQVDLTPGLPGVVADTIQIQQVVLNLIRNGVEASAAAPGPRRVSVETSEPELGVVQVSVSDQGSGLTDEQLARVFEPFFTTKESGLGMGLAISRSIITSHGGRMWCIRGEQGGASFRFTLPTTVRESGGRLVSRELSSST